MQCYHCLTDAKERLTNYIVDMGKKIIIIRDVPSCVCPSCGTTMYTSDVSKQLESLVRSVYNSPMEISIMQYSR